MRTNIDGLTEVQTWFYHWIVEREKCRIGRERGLPKPWSEDPVLQSYRFCNVERESDVVTKWIHNNWLRTTLAEDPKHAMFMMVVARTVNSVDTLTAIGIPLLDTCAWIERARVVMKQRREQGLQVWTGAYLISTNGHSMDKVDYVLDKVWKPILRHARGPYEGESLECYHKYLTHYDGLGSFMAGQVIADLKFTAPLDKAPDWHSWAPIGPGSRRGMNLYHNRPSEKSISEKQFIKELSELQQEIKQRLGLNIAAHNVQNCLCELSKYAKVRLGLGRPRSLYNGRG